MKYSDAAGNLNRHLSRLHPKWADLPIWERTDEPSIIHMTYSAVLAVIQDAEVEWAALAIENEHSRDETAFGITFWTADLVVHATRVPRQLHPLVKVAKRSDLVSLEVLSTPLLTISDWNYHDDAVSLNLAYPTFRATLTEPKGDTLIAALPDFLADL